MEFSDSELALRFRKRARRALLAGLAALNALPAERKKSVSKLTVEVVHEALSVAVLRFVVLALGRARGLFTDEPSFALGRLFVAQHPLLDVRPTVAGGELRWLFPDALSAAESAFRAELEVGLASDGIDFGQCGAELVGNLYELLLGEGVLRGERGLLELASGTKRKQTGTFFTPRALTEVVVSRALEPLERLRNRLPGL